MSVGRTVSHVGLLVSLLIAPRGAASFSGLLPGVQVPSVILRLIEKSVARAAHAVNIPLAYGPHLLILFGVYRTSSTLSSPSPAFSPPQHRQPAPRAIYARSKTPFNVLGASLPQHMYAGLCLAW